jgi:hypothetical protein
MPRDKNPATAIVKKRAPRKSVSTAGRKPGITRYVGLEQRAALKPRFSAPKSAASRLAMKRKTGLRPRPRWMQR